MHDTCRSKWQYTCSLTMIFFVLKSVFSLYLLFLLLCYILVSQWCNYWLHINNHNLYFGCLFIVVFQFVYIRNIVANSEKKQANNETCSELNYSAISAINFNSLKTSPIFIWYKKCDNVYHLLPCYISLSE
jgi:hypothetical protein